MLLAGPLAQLPLGDEAAAGIGVRPMRSRILLVVIAVALMAVATASTGPIPFIALAAPHLMRRLTRTSGVPLAGAALMGGVLVLVSDLVARRLFAPTELAVGIVTGALGGAYLVWLLIVERKRLWTRTPRYPPVPRPRRRPPRDCAAKPCAPATGPVTRSCTVSTSRCSRGSSP